MLGSGYRCNGPYAVTLLNPENAILESRKRIPLGAPSWMTPKHIILCIQNERIQTYWHSIQISEGDWFLTTWEGIENILQVDSSYWHDVDLKSEPEQGYLGRLFINESEKQIRKAFGCDYYIPDPQTLSRVLKAYKAFYKEPFPKKKSR